MPFQECRVEPDCLMHMPLGEAELAESLWPRALAGGGNPVANAQAFPPHCKARSRQGPSEQRYTPVGLGSGLPASGLGGEREPRARTAHRRWPLHPR